MARFSVSATSMRLEARPNKLRAPSLSVQTLYHPKSTITLCLLSTVPAVEPAPMEQNPLRVSRARYYRDP